MNKEPPQKTKKQTNVQKTRHNCMLDCMPYINLCPIPNFGKELASLGILKREWCSYTRKRAGLRYIYRERLSRWLYKRKTSTCK